MIKKLITASLFVASVSFAAPKVHQLADSKENAITWTAVGNPGFLRINGEGGKAAGELMIDGDYVSGTISAPLDMFTTGMGLRDRHMKEKYLDVKGHPEALLKLEKMRIAPSFSFKGDLTIKGTTKPIEGQGTYENGKVACDFKVNLDDYPEVGVPSWLGVTMAREVDVNVKFSIP